MDLDTSVYLPDYQRDWVLMPVRAFMDLDTW